MKYIIGILIGITLNQYIALGSMDILMMLVLIHKHGICASTYLYLLQFLSSVSYNFPSTGPLHRWLDLFLCILFF